MSKKYHVLCQMFGSQSISQDIPALYTIHCTSENWRVVYNKCQSLGIAGLTNLNGVCKIYVDME